MFFSRRKGEQGTYFLFTIVCRGESNKWSHNRQQALFRVLQAYSEYNPTVGYCQGMGFICAVLLLYLNEVETFSVLRRFITDYGMSGLYEVEFPKLRICFEVLDSLIKAWLPRLHSHLVSRDFFRKRHCPDLIDVGVGEN